MKKRIVFLSVLVLLILAFCSCDEECRHQNMSETVIDATCTANGQVTHTCFDCGYTYITDIIEPRGHSFIKKEVASLCTTDGYTEYSCECGFSYISDYVSATGHKYTDDITSSACESGGYATHTCTVCEYSYISNHTDPKPHELEENIVAPTCTEQGYTVSSCKKCSYTYTSSYTAPAGHKYSSETLSDLTCTTAGRVKYTCECGDTYTVTTAPEGHSFQALTTMPTLSDMGYTEFTCSKCEYKYIGDYVFYSDIFKDAYAESTEVLKKGIDVSYHNYSKDAQDNYIPLDWELIRESGVDYVIIRAGYSSQTDGTFYADETFELSYEGAKAAGLDVGVYFYTCARSVNDIKIEANQLIKLLSGKQFEYPVYLDLEDEETYLNSEKTELEGFNKATINQMCTEFFTTLQSAGYYTGLYVSYNWLYNIIDTDYAISHYDIWCAKWHTYEGEAEWSVQDYGHPFGMWQYSESGSIAGVGEPFDLNYCFKDYPDIIKAGGFNGYRTDVRFPDTNKQFVFIEYELVNIRSEWDLSDSSNILGQVSRGELLELIELTDECAVVYYKGQIAYISKNSEYISIIEIV